MRVTPPLTSLETIVRSHLRRFFWQGVVVFPKVRGCEVVHRKTGLQRAAQSRLALFAHALSECIEAACLYVLRDLAVPLVSPILLNPF